VEIVNLFEEMKFVIATLLLAIVIIFFKTYITFTLFLLSSLYDKLKL